MSQDDTFTEDAYEGIFNGLKKPKEASLRKRTEYLELREIGLKPATKVYGIFSTRHGDKLGEIKWYAPWRQFAFFPTLETIWNETCLSDVIHFIHIAKNEGRLRK